MSVPVAICNLPVNAFQQNDAIFRASVSWKLVSHLGYMGDWYSERCLSSRSWKKNRNISAVERKV